MEEIFCNPVFQALLIIDMVVIPFALILISWNMSNKKK